MTMSINMKIFLICTASFLIGAGAMYGYFMLTPSTSTNEMSKKMPAPQDQMVALDGTQPAVDEMLVAESSGEMGIVSGTLGYPSEMIPAVSIYAFNSNDETQFFSVETSENDQTFSLDVPAGTYYLVAYPLGTPEMAGGYSQAVPCGLTVECTDHSLIPVTVAAGEIIDTIEIKDWYAEPGTFPVKPN